MSSLPSHGLRLGLVSAVLVTAVSGLSAQVQELQSPFEPAAGFQVQGALAIDFDLTSYQLLDRYFRSNQPVRLLDFELPGRAPVALELLPTRAMAPGAKAIVVGEQGEYELAPTVATFGGFIPGEEGSAFFSISPTMMNGYVHVGGELFFISSGGLSGTAIVSNSASFAQTGAGAKWCNVAQELIGQGAPGQGGGPDMATPQVRFADAFVECDHDFTALFANVQQATDYANVLMAANAFVYRRDNGVVIEIPNNYLRVWTTTPPWGSITSFNGISQVQSYWTSAANPMRNLPRACVHVLTNPVFGGVAWNIGGICDNNQGYEVSSVFGSFPQPLQHTSANNWDLFVVTHEFGHSFGSQHTFDYNPPITCTDGSGPDQGTIMSYCHGNPGGVANVGMRFHSRVQDVIRNYMSGRNCVTSTNIQAGDYDYNNVLDAADLSAMDMCLNQGFISRGCEESMDMDGDGDVDSCDEDILESIVNGHALTLTQGTLRRGASVTFSASGGNSGETAYFLYSFNAGGSCPGKLGTALLLSPPVEVIGTATANGSGTASLTITIPNSAPLRDVTTQAAIRRGAGGVNSVTSNAITATIQP